MAVPSLAALVAFVRGPSAALCGRAAGVLLAVLPEMLDPARGLVPFAAADVFSAAIAALACGRRPKLVQAALGLARDVYFAAVLRAGAHPAGKSATTVASFPPSARPRETLMCLRAFGAPTPRRRGGRRLEE